MYNLTIISMFKNESLILEEWIKYYIEQGVEHFYLIDNGSDDNYETQINRYIDKITLIKDPFRLEKNTTNKVKSYDNKKNEYIFENDEANNQVLLSNNLLLEKIKLEAKWTMFIDCDEYIYIPSSKNINIFLTTLNKYNKYDKITDIFIPWKIFGSNNLDKQPKSIINGFNKRWTCDDFKKKVLNHGNVRGHGKSITKTKYLTLLGVHKCNFYIPQLTLMPDFSIIPNNNKDKLIKFIKNFNYNKTFIQCNHYMIMSREYFFNHKIKRPPGGRSGCHTHSYWNKHNINDEIDNVLINYKNKK